MRSMFKNLAFIVVALAVSVVPSLAQTTTTKTFLSSAITSTLVNTVVVNANTGMTASTSAAQTFILIDKELMQLVTINSTTLTVRRGYGSTIATKHASGSLVVYGTVGSWNPNTGDTTGVFLIGNRPTPVEGTPCTSANQQYTSIYGADDGAEHICSGSAWRTIAVPAGVQGINQIILCGDLPNNTTDYLGAAFGFPAGTGYDAGLTANDLSFSLTGTGCDGLDSTTEATADTVMYANNTMRVLGMVCQVGSAGSNGITLNFRANTANLTPDLSITIPTGSTTGAAWLSNPAPVAANTPIDVRAIDTENLSASNGWCQVTVQVLP